MKGLVILLAVLLVCSQAVQVKKTLTNSQVKRIDNLKKGNTWGSFMMELAELHTMSQGPLDDLIVAIQEVVIDVERKTENSHAAFDLRTQQHTSDVRRYTDYISEANRNIAETHELIDNILLPQKAQLHEEIASLNRNIADSEAHIVSITNDREAAHSEYLTRQTEHAEALQAIGEALQVLSQLEEGTSLIQMKKIEKSVGKVKKVFQGKKNVQSTFVKALLQLTSSGFTDSDSLNRVFALLRQIEEDLSNSQVQETANEQTAQESFENDVKNTQQNIVSYREQVQSTQDELARTEDQISNARSYIEQREYDLTVFQADLAAEIAAYEEATRVYEDLIAQLTSEAAACNEALDVVQNASIDDYVGERMSQTSDNVIGQGGSRSRATLGADII